jgi:hypothetical protein
MSVLAKFGPVATVSVLSTLVGSMNLWVFFVYDKLIKKKFGFFLIQAHDYTRGAALPDKTTHLTLHGVCEAISKIDWEAPVPDGMTANQFFIVRAACPGYDEKGQ